MGVDEIGVDGLGINRYRDIDSIINASKYKNEKMENRNRRATYHGKAKGKFLWVLEFTWKLGPSCFGQHDPLHLNKKMTILPFMFLWIIREPVRCMF